MFLEPRNKLNEKQSTIATHKAMGYCPMIDWKNKEKNDLMTIGTCATPWKDCIQNSSIKIQS